MRLLSQRQGQTSPAKRQEKRGLKDARCLLSQLLMPSPAAQRTLTVAHQQGRNQSGQARRQTGNQPGQPSQAGQTGRNQPDRDRRPVSEPVRLRASAGGFGSPAAAAAGRSDGRGRQPSSRACRPEPSRRIGLHPFRPRPISLHPFRLSVAAVRSPQTRRRRGPMRRCPI